MKTSLAKFSQSICIAIASFGVLISPGVAQELTTAKQVIQFHVKSLGGRAKLEAVKTITTKASMLIPGGPNGEMNADLNLLQKSNKFSLVMNIASVGDIQQGSDGKHFWIIMPFQGERLMDDNEQALSKQQFSSPFPSLSWADNYDGKIKLDGTEDVDDAKCYKVVFKPKDGKPLTRFFDVKSGRLLKMNSIQSNPAGEMEVTIFPSDFKEVDGITIPFTQITQVNGGDITMKTESVKFNVKIEDKQFEMPDAIKKLVKEK